ncbi:MAG: glycosyltransferase, partial [Candidatus Entotheonellia bacterium]
AMACAVPCTATDVGDSASIVGETGRVVPPRHPQALAEAWRALLELGAAGRARLGWAARRRIEAHFSLPAVIARYEQLYRESLRPAPVRSGHGSDHPFPPAPPPTSILPLQGGGK